MKPGPPPKPTKLRLLQGNPSRRPINTNEPQPTSIQKTPPAPKYLRRTGRAEWRRVAKLLVNLGLLTDLDLTALGAYCASYQRWLTAEKTLEKDGMAFTAPTGQVKRSPYLLIAREAMADMRGFMQEFGMTPASRSRVEVSGKPTDQEKVEEFLFGPRNTS